MQKYSYSARCACGRVTLSLQLPLPVQQLQVRVCDCSYCKAGQLAWLSHPQMRLSIESAGAHLRGEKQGSRQAEFLKCKDCDSTLAVMFDFGDRKIGALNAQLLVDGKSLERVTVSPKKLSADEKLARWKKVWGEVVLNS